MPYKNSRGMRSSRGVNSKEWTGALIGANSISSGSVAGWIVDPPTMINQYESPTIIRLLVSVCLILNAQAQNNIANSFGIYVASGDEDLTTVPTEYWDPATDQQSDWMYRFNTPLPAGTVAGHLSCNGGADITIDVRTKRKVPRGSGLLAVFQSDAPTGSGGSFNASADVRCLIISG